MKIFLLTCSIFISAQTIAQSSLNDAYSEGLKQGQGNIQKSVTSVQDFNPSETFKDKGGKSYFTENPPQISYYQKVEQGNKDILEDSGRKYVDSNEITNEATAAVWKSFGNPKIKLDPNEPFFDKSREIIKNSAAIVTGVSSKPGEIVKEGGTAGVNCQESKICRIDYIKKTCNEEIRPLKKACEKIPKINTAIDRTVFPNCQRLVVVQNFRISCPPGYGEIAYSDMINNSQSDDVRLCVKNIGENEGYECHGGYSVYGVYTSTSNRRTIGPGRGVVPKNLRGRIKFSNCYTGNMVVTIVNETSGETLCNKCQFGEGQVFDLGVSENQDRTFRFDVDTSRTKGFWRSYGSGIGVIVLYVDRVSEKKTATFDSWTEVNCHES